jgi:tRNA modification GTPase
LAEPDTLVACLTPPGTAAIATLALRGPRAWEVVRRLFRPRNPSGPPLPAEPEAGQIWLGQLGETIRDEVVVTAGTTPAGPWVEVHCHGGREVIRLLLETFAGQGARVCSWQELERLTTERPLQALAAAAVAEARTTRTAAILLDQYHGALERALAAILAGLDQRDCGEAGQLLAELAARADLGRHLTASWRVAVAGAPNVGKSSLVNALAGYQRSIVAATPGTTRDVVTTALAIDGWPVELADTAGIRSGTDSLEEQGIHRAEAALGASDLCLWVLDASVAPVLPPPGAPRARLVVNKIDLEPAWDLDRAGDAVRVSALTGTGLADLCATLSRWLVPEPPPPRAAVPFTAALADRVEEAWQHFAAGREPEARQTLVAASSG